MPAESFMSCGPARLFLKGIVTLAITNFAHFGFSARGQTVNIILPTENHGLLNGDNAAFYQYVKRDFEGVVSTPWRSEEHTSELQSRVDLVCRLLLEKKKKKKIYLTHVEKKKNKTNNKQ